jgi:tripartite-type tricarboxylate transporter receptor subunit TctC
VHPKLPARTVGELIGLAKSRPGELNFGSTGSGGLSHLAGELFKNMTEVQMTHVPYKGTGPAQTDLLAGQIQLMFNDTAVPHVKAEKLRALAVTGDRRWPQLPDVPTFAELGIQGYETYNWFGILAPRATPDGVIARLNRELVAVMQEPAVQEWMRSRGAEPVTNSPGEFAAYIRKDLAKWARVVKEVGIIAE